MSKYNYVVLNVEKLNKGESITSSDNVRSVLKEGYVIYIYSDGKKNGKRYIGQTKHFLQRNKEHYLRDKEFISANFNKVMVIYSRYFNGSALDDVEQQLITYFIADDAGEIKNGKIINYDGNVINKTGGNSVNEYENRDKIVSDVILPLWEKDLYPQGWVNTPTLSKLRSKELFKYSPIKTLTKEQKEIIQQIIQNQDKSYVINGDAGTGKTVLLTHLAASYIKKFPNLKIAVVVQPNWEKIAKEIFKTYGLINNNLFIGTSTKVIRKQGYYDVIIVDEAHKLSRKYNKQHSSFNSVYKIPQFKNCNSHLSILKKKGKQLILMYDVLQAIRPANILRKDFAKETKSFEKIYLTTQFRIKAPQGKSYSSDDYINGIKYLLYKDTGLLKYTNFDSNFNREVFNDNSENAYFGYFEEKPLFNLFEWIEEDMNAHPEHIDRVLAGLVEPWKQKDGKNPNIKHWKEGNIEKRWNSRQDNWLSSKDSEDEVGSVFAVQGIDLNKVGVLIGKDLQVDVNGKLYANPDNFYNENGRFKREEENIPENKKEFTIFVLNIYYVLMTRGIDGIRVGFWKNKEFMQYMKDTLMIK